MHYLYGLPSLDIQKRLKYDKATVNGVVGYLAGNFSRATAYLHNGMIYFVDVSMRERGAGEKSNARKQSNGGHIDFFPLLSFWINSNADINCSEHFFTVE